jgi:hypothetical protein
MGFQFSFGTELREIFFLLRSRFGTEGERIGGPPD